MLLEIFAHKSKLAQILEPCCIVALEREAGQLDVVLVADLLPVHTVVRSDDLAQAQQSFPSDVRSAQGRIEFLPNEK